MDEIKNKKEQIRKIQNEINLIKWKIQQCIFRTMSHEVRIIIYSIESDIVIHDISYDVGSNVTIDTCEDCRKCDSNIHIYKQKQKHVVINIDGTYLGEDVQINILFSDMWSPQMLVIINGFTYFDADDNFGMYFCKCKEGKYIETQIYRYSYTEIKAGNILLDSFKNTENNFMTNCGKTRYRINNYKNLYESIKQDYKKYNLYDYQCKVRLVLLARLDKNSILSTLPKDILILIAKKI